MNAYVKISPDAHWMLSRVETILGLWETQDDEPAKLYALPYLEDLRQYLAALDGNYHASAILDVSGAKPSIHIEDGLTKPCGREIF